MGAEVHELMSRSGNQSEARFSVFKRPSKLVTDSTNRTDDGAVFCNDRPLTIFSLLWILTTVSSDRLIANTPSIMACEKKWLPLESNPDVMNKFLSNVGVPEDFTMIDVVDLDEEHLENLPKKIKAVLFLFPTGEQHDEHCQSEQETIDAEGQVVSDRVYFMKVDANNASGTVSLIHAVANADDELELGERPTSFPKKIQPSLTRDSNPNPLGYKPRVIAIMLAG
ncbi:ubiquitin carboxyl-terminal hydrolase isozyme L3 [Trichonephila clavipes]|nr:ubiquitin carboxyl-terminal hydrolase isozyme L3 [Trichonephila clavipes]